MKLMYIAILIRPVQNNEEDGAIDCQQVFDDIANAIEVIVTWHWMGFFDFLVK